MSVQPSELEHSRNKDFLATASKAAPAIALFAGLMYVMGLYSAYRMDATLGVGTIEVSRERAVCLGIVQGLVCLPAIAFWIGLRESDSLASEIELWKRLKGVLVALLFSVLAGVLVVVLTRALMDVQNLGAPAVLMSLPVFVMAVLCTYSPRNVRRFLKFWPLDLIIFLSLLATTAGNWVPMQFGGHVGVKVKVILKNGVTYSGDLKTSDNRAIVLRTADKTLALSRDEILTIESSAKQAGDLP